MCQWPTGIELPSCWFSVRLCHVHFLTRWKLNGLDFSLQWQEELAGVTDSSSPRDRWLVIMFLTLTVYPCYGVNTNS